MNAQARTSIHIESNLQNLTEFAAREILHRLDEALTKRPRATLMLSGGNTPKPLFELFAKLKRDWSKIDFFFSDERNVPITDPQSNAGMAKKTFFDPAGIKPEQIFRIEGEKEAAVAAQSYHDTLTAYFKKREMAPSFDVALLGMGADGHTASLFPDTDWQDSKDALAQAFYVDKMKTWRISLSLKALRTAQTSFVLVAGSEKQKAVREAIGLAPLVRDLLPIEAITPENGSLVWLLDRAAVFGEPAFHVNS